MVFLSIFYLFPYSGSLLESLLSVESTKSNSNYPSLEDLLSNSFFSNATGSSSLQQPELNGKKPYLKFSMGSKEALSRHKESFEKRLEEDHKRFKMNEKDKKRREILNDDARKKKRQLKNQVSLDKLVESIK